MTRSNLQSAVIGLDIGATSTTAAVLTGAGVAALAYGPGANPRSSGGDLPAQLSAVLAAAVAEAGHVEVTACVAGVSGAGPAGRQRAQELLAEAADRAGLGPAALEVVGDPDIAFAAGSPGPDGVLLLAGTGAIACRYQNFDQVFRADGLGWMLGDAGGGIWLGLEGLRAVATALDGRGPQTSMTEPALRLAAETGPTTGDPRQDLVRLTDHRTPAELGAFAPTVAAQAAAGDAVAAAITARGADALLNSLTVVDHGELPVVLAGSVLTTAGPVRDRIQQQLSGRYYQAGQPVLGALRLAADRAGWPVPRLEALDLTGAKTLEVPAAAARPGAAAGPAEELVVDHYHRQDWEALYEICLLTGDSGEDASGLYRDPDLLGHVFLGAYLQLAPHLARVLRRPDGTAVGYCVAAADTASFEDQCEKTWWPPLRERYPEPAESDDSADARMIRKIHHPGRTDPALLGHYPAHLHIDLLPQAQGGGNGARLLLASLQALSEHGAAGVHLGVGARNVRAIGFYEHMGLRTLQHLSMGLMMGARLPLPHPR